MRVRSDWMSAMWNHHTQKTSVWSREQKAHPWYTKVRRFILLIC